MGEISVWLIVALVALTAVSVIVWRKRREQPPAALPGPGLLGTALRRLWGQREDGEVWTDLEEALLAADVGAEATQRVIARVRTRSPATFEEGRDALARAMLEEMSEADRELRLDGSPGIVLVVGVNGSGKTTTVAKLAHRLGAMGLEVLVAAADTYRAAAVEQLREWGERTGARVVAGAEGADPGSVVHDAVDAARAAGADVVLIDTAGRLHSKRDLMDELRKVHRVAGGTDAVEEVLLVLDATTGQNGLAQVAEFMAAVPVTGLVLAKLDGTARGGIVVNVESSLGVPVKLVGTGEGAEDLAPFDPDAFVTTLLG